MVKTVSLVNDKIFSLAGKCCDSPAIRLKFFDGFPAMLSHEVFIFKYLWRRIMRNTWGLHPRVMCPPPWGFVWTWNLGTGLGAVGIIL